MTVPSYVDELNALPPLREMIKTYGLSAKKSLGQNFLFDLNLTRKIARAGHLTPETHVIEIGPGPGGLTRALLEQDVASLTVIERDNRCVEALTAQIKPIVGDHLNMIEGDALEVNPIDLTPEPRAIVANLPYNIATPLLIRWLRDAEQYQSFTLMFQKEVVMRIAASPNTKAYGRLSVLCQWLCQCQRMFDVPASAFTPPPKITSSIVRLVPKKREGNQPTLKTLEMVTGLAFGQRRKMLRQSLKTLHSDIVSFLESLDIQPTLRADAVSVDQYITIACAVESIQG